MNKWPDGVRKFDSIDEGGLLVCLTKEVDLDQLMVAAAERHFYDEGYWGDEPTRLPDERGCGQVDVGWFRKIPCGPNSCGEHSWHVTPVDGPAPGAFLGVFIW